MEEHQKRIVDLVRKYFPDQLRDWLYIETSGGIPTRTEYDIVQQYFNMEIISKLMLVESTDRLSSLIEKQLAATNQQNKMLGKLDEVL